MQNADRGMAGGGVGTNGGLYDQGEGEDVACSSSQRTHLVWIAVHVTKDERHLGKNLRHQLRHLT